MTVEKYKDGQKLTLTVIGRVDSSVAFEFEKAVDEVDADIKELVMDFSNLEYISSAGLRVLLKALKMMKNKGNLKILNVNENIKEIFDITGFSDILDI